MFIILPEYKGDLIGVIFHKGPPTSSGHYTYMFSVNKIWDLCNNTIIK